MLETDRLRLRPWRVTEAAVHHELWTERDPRVPPHRRIAPDGSPTVEDLEDAIRATPPPPSVGRRIGLLAVERKAEGDVVGYCGLVDGPVPDAVPDAVPELAFELLRRVWGRGYATEASRAVLAWAGSAGHTELSATVWEWNVASRRVLAKLGFDEARRIATSHGTNLEMRLRL